MSERGKNMEEGLIGKCSGQGGWKEEVRSGCGQDACMKLLNNEFIKDPNSNTPSKTENKQTSNNK